jgi:hypothetical protein
MSAKQDKQKVPTEFEKCYLIVEDGKTFEVFYNPTEKDSLKAYIKKECN